MKLFQSALAALCIVASMLAVPALAQPVFKTDRVITAEEIEPAVKVMNDWNAKLYPAFKLRYSSDPNALQVHGQIALRGSNRLIALFVSKYVMAGAKSTLFLPGHRAKPEITASIMDQMMASSYAEAGYFERVTMGNLNDTPGAVLVGLVETGAKLPEQPSSAAPPNVSAEIAQIRAAADAIERKVAY